MEQRIKRDSALISLVSEFEANFENGNVEYLDEKLFSQLIGYYEDEKEFDKALDVAKLAIDQFKYRAEFYISNARLLLKSSDTEGCLKYIQLAQTISPFETEITILKVRALAQSGEYEFAFNELQELKSTALQGDMAEILLCEAEIYLKMGKGKEMFDTVKLALDIDPLNEDGLEKFWIATEMGKRYFECIDYMKDLIDKDPYNHLAWFNLGHAYSFNADYEDAIDAIEYSFIIKSNFEQGYLDCADLCCQVKDFDRALKIYNDAMVTFGEDLELLTRAAECQMYLNKTKECKINLHKALKIDPYNDEIYYFMGECYSKEKKWYSAINAFHKAIEIDDECGDYYLGVARAYVAVEDYNKATINFQLAVSDGPELTHFWTEFVSFLFKLGLYEEAMKVLDEAEDFTFGADLLYLRALTSFFLDDKEEGLHILEEALMEDYSMHTILFSLAPELEVDKEIGGMIKYFAGEQE